MILVVKGVQMLMLKHRELQEAKLTERETKALIANWVADVNASEQEIPPYTRLVTSPYPPPFYISDDSFLAEDQTRGKSANTPHTKSDKRDLEDLQIAQLRYDEMATGQVLSAKVKSVISGDTIVLSHPSDPRKERQLSLAFVTAPRLKKEGDEPFAYASRDFLRKQFVGKIVNFRVLYVIPQSKREYGVVWLQGGVQVPEAAVKEGWLKVRDDAGKRDETEEVKQLAEKLQLAEAHAKADGKGVWADEKREGDVECAYELADPKGFVEENKGKTLDGKDNIRI